MKIQANTAYSLAIETHRTANDLIDCRLILRHDGTLRAEIMAEVYVLPDTEQHTVVGRLMQQAIAKAALAP
jgi:hypothetical protein